MSGQITLLGSSLSAEKSLVAYGPQTAIISFHIITERGGRTLVPLYTRFLLLTAPYPAELRWETGWGSMWCA